MIDDPARGQKATGWTVDTLKQYVDSGFVAQEKAVSTEMVAAEKAVAAALAAAEKAVQKAEIASDKRLDGVNELRTMALDWKSEFARQTTVDLQQRALGERIDSAVTLINSLDKRIAARESRGEGLNTGWGYLVGGIGFLVAVAALFMDLTEKH
jgi:hypothetical protein